jgi:hypothetical protein
LVEGALLVVLDVHDDVAEVDEHPAVLALALAAQGLGRPCRAGRSSTSSTIAPTWRSLVAEAMTKTSVSASCGDVDGDDVLGLLVGGAGCGGSGEVDGSGSRGAHGFLGW